MEFFFSTKLDIEFNDPFWALVPKNNSFKGIELQKFLALPPSERNNLSQITLRPSIKEALINLLIACFKANQPVETTIVCAEKNDKNYHIVIKSDKRSILIG